MSNELKLSAEIREDQGKGASRRLRREQKIPAVMYGDNKEPVSLSVSTFTINKMLMDDRFYSQIIDIEVNGEVTETVLRDLQRHPAKKEILHMDFQRITRGQELTVSVPITYLNAESALGVKEGGILNTSVIEMEVTCRPSLIPTAIEVDVAGLNIGDAIHLSDVQLPEGVRATALDSEDGHDATLVVVNAPKGGSDDTPAEASEEEASE